MQVGTAQSQSLIASISVSTQVRATPLSAQDGAPADAVLLTIGKQIDVNYSRTVLRNELADSLDAALQQAGVEGLTAEDLLSGAMDTSPEATATRIVDFATSFFAAFQANHAQDEGDGQIDGFTELIKGAVEEGFAQAREILKGIGRISSAVAEDMDRTFDLVMKGIEDWARERHEALLESPPQDEEEAALLAA